MRELRQKPEVFVGRRLRNRNWTAGVEGFVAGVGLKFARLPIAGVWGIETDREAEWLCVGAGIEKLQRLIPESGSRVCLRRILRVDEPFPGLSGKPAKEIEISGLRSDVRGVADAEFADETGPVTRGAQQRRVRLCPLRGCQRRLEVADAVAPLVLAGEDRGAADAADGCRDKMIAKPRAARREAVNVRRPDKPIARATHRVKSLIVGQDEDEVGTLRLGGV